MWNTFHSPAYTNWQSSFEVFDGMKKLRTAIPAGSKAIHWRDLPHEEWDLAILQAVQFRTPHDAVLDARRLWIQEKLAADPHLHGEYLSHLLGEVIMQLRVCRDVYRRGLDAIKKDTQLNRHRYAVEYAVAPRAAHLLRCALEDYFSRAKVSFASMQLLFDPNFPQGIRISLSGEEPRQPSKTFAELLETIIPDEAFQGIARKRSFLSGAPFHPSVISGRAILGPGVLSHCRKLYASKKPWITRASFLWDSVLHEVKRQHKEVDIEKYGRQLDSEEQRKLREIVELYGRLRDSQTGRISAPDLAEVAKRADDLGMKSQELLDGKGRKCLASTNQKRQKSVASVSELASATSRLPGHERSLQGFLKKFLSDALGDLHSSS